MKCPNCTKEIIAQQGDYIQCQDCGWFILQPDGTYTACEPPEPVEPKETSSLQPEPEPEPSNNDDTAPADSDFKAAAPTDSGNGTEDNRTHVRISFDDED